MTDRTQINGNWEVPGVIGTRIEINGDKIIVLWMSSPTLSTTFETKATDDGGIELILKDNALRNGGVSDPYATVEHLIYKDDRLRFVKNFDITGLSEEILSRTEYSRYGNVTIRDELLDQVQGRWYMKNNDALGFGINGNTLTIGGDSFTVRAAVRNGWSSRGEDFAIINRDPARKGIGYYEEMLYVGGEIRAYILVCDLGMQEMVFRRKP